MKLIECYIESFGKIKDNHIKFADGLNCIMDANGSGKTTLSVFIKVMLYGMSDTKKTSLDENDRKHYLPWDGSAARGTLTFETDGKRYRIERFLAPKPADDSFTLYDCSTGKLSQDFTERVGEELFGIDADGFERTVFLSERALTPKSENKSVSAKLSDLVGCDGDIGVMDDAMKLLEDKRKFYYKKGGSGELSNIRLKVVEATKALERLTGLEADAEKAEKRSAELLTELKKLAAEKEKLIKERESSAISSAKADFKRRYDELKSEIDALSERKGILFDFFKGDPPTFSEIAKNALMLSEAESVEQKLKCNSENPEYSELKKYFFGKLDEAEAENIRNAIYHEKAQKNAINSEKAKTLAEKSEKRTRAPFLITGVIILILGFCLGLFLNFAFLSFMLLGAVSIAIAFKGKGTSERDSASTVTNNSPSPILSSFCKKFSYDLLKRKPVRRRPTEPLLSEPLPTLDDDDE